MKDVPYTPPPVDSVEFDTDQLPATDPGQLENTSNTVEFVPDPLNPSVPSTQNCNFPTYAVRYPQLMDRHGINVKGYIDDYMSEGAALGRDCRVAASIWSPKAYKERYATELANITDAQSLWEHYVNIGRHQGWNASATNTKTTPATTPPEQNAVMWIKIVRECAPAHVRFRCCRSVVDRTVTGSVLPRQIVLSPCSERMPMAPYGEEHFAY